MTPTSLPAQVDEAVAALRRGEVVGYPTETFYGLGVDANSPSALSRLMETKGREVQKTISVLVSGVPMLETICADVSPLARQLMAAHWPGPLTLALPARPGLPEALVSDGCVAVRHSPHPVAAALVAALGRPLTATSANRAGQPPCTVAAEVVAAFGSAFLVVDGGSTPGGAPSTLLRVRGDNFEILRHGAIDARALIADDDVTHDTLLRGQVKLLQPARGFRSSLDPLLLASFLAPPYGHFLDIGTGTGAVSFCLLARDARASGVGLEIQPRLARLATRGVAENGFEGRYQLRQGDARTVVHSLPAGSFDLVATNPPYRPIGVGVLPADAERGTAHHEVSLTLNEWLDVATHALRPEGRLGVVFPASRAEELCAALCTRGLSPSALRWVFPRQGQPAGRLLIEARRGPSRTVVEYPALFIHHGEQFSPEMLTMMGDGDGEGAQTGVGRRERGGDTPS